MHVMILRQIGEGNGLLIGFIHLVRYKHSLLKRCSFNSWCCCIVIGEAKMAMAVDTAPFRLGPIFHFCRAGKFQFLHTILNILFAIGFDNSDQFVAR